MVAATAAALAAPVAIQRQARASRIVPSPIVIASLRSRAAGGSSARFASSVSSERVFTRVRLPSDEPGSLKPMCAFAPRPRIWRSMPPASRIAAS
jgi:hypothetical protein